jgi:hypothetical protein
LLRGVLGGKGSRLIVQNADDFDACLRAHIAPPENLRLIRGSGVDTNRFRPGIGRAVPAVTRVLLAARLIFEKGIHEYVEAARLLSESNNPVEFLLAGEPDPGNPGAIDASLVQQWQSKGWVNCLGHVSDMPALLGEIDIAVLPSYGGEGVPRGLLEAAAAGLPVIASDVPGCREIVEHGVNGIMVSNHGARQLDNAPSPLEVLPAINSAVGDKMTLMLDGGVRRGLDALIAICMGAKFVFVGRPTLYGVTAGGIPGAKMALNIFRREIDISMAQMGAPKISDLGPQFLMWKDEEDLRRNRR